MIRWSRIVAVVALAWKADANAPAARVRLCARAARASQAAFTWKCPEGAEFRDRMRERGLVLPALPDDLNFIEEAENEE